MEIKAIAHIHNDYIDKFGIPRQSSLVPEALSRIIFTKPYRQREALRGLEGYSHLWLIWEFSESHREHWSATVRPPRLKGNTRMGVFATRSPFRPNPLGLSVVKIETIELDTPEGPVITVSGADLLNGTPIMDIKPYLPHVDAVEGARGGFAVEFKDYGLEVECAPELLSVLPLEKQQAVLGILAQDPRPSYQNDPERIYGLDYGAYNIKFKVVENKLIVTKIARR